MLKQIQHDIFASGSSDFPVEVYYLPPLKRGGKKSPRPWRERVRERGNVFILMTFLIRSLTVRHNTSLQHEAIDDTLDVAIVSRNHAELQSKFHGKLFQLPDI